MPHRADGTWQNLAQYQPHWWLTEPRGAGVPGTGATPSATPAPLALGYPPERHPPAATRNAPGARDPVP
jgi:hypothetical protein